MGLQYVGWHSLVQAHSSWHRGEPNNSDKIEYAIVRLKESIDAGQFVLLSALVMYLVNRTPDASFSDTWYLLGRAYQERDAHREAHGAFQQAVYSEPSASVYWLSIAILFFRINQYRDSFDAMDRSVRLNPFAAITWLNLDILYARCQQGSDAFDAIQRSSELEGGQQLLEAAGISIANGDFCRHDPSHYSMVQPPLLLVHEPLDSTGLAEEIVIPELKDHIDFSPEDERS
ncbi:glucose repression mediator protein [Exophiala xenobiotica]|uniref:Glucose repression mediator protein n=1 Tax=Lithohypha guttulata TaxID=1690604 RepID=A0ABR0KNZ2_9EURO|nr:glucose repression mediator protein [Lithohypha guttulata]KAK5330729.1 glucose repression mediator protein [Exophiala xenobiotica]